MAIPVSGASQCAALKAAAITDAGDEDHGSADSEASVGDGLVGGERWVEVVGGGGGRPAEGVSGGRDERSVGVERSAEGAGGGWDERPAEGASGGRDEGDDGGETFTREDLEEGAMVDPWQFGGEGDTDCAPVDAALTSAKLAAVSADPPVVVNPSGAAASSDPRAVLKPPGK